MAKVPIEWFGWKIPTCRTNDARVGQHHQQCRFTESLCAKPRKSTPEIRTGICTVNMTGGFFDGTRRVIICPKRFEVDIFFNILSARYFTPGHKVTFTPEVQMGDFGNVDYVASQTYIDVHGRSQNNLVLFELQAGGTTGSPYPAIEQYIEYGRFLNTSYKFGINWANEFIKTMGQQIVKKGHAVRDWGVPLVFVIQDIAMEYIEDKMNTANLVRRSPGDPWPADEYIHFRTIRMGAGDDTMYSLVEGDFYTASLETAEAMLTVEGRITLNQFRSDLQTRMRNASNRLVHL